MSLRNRIGRSGGEPVAMRGVASGSGSFRVLNPFTLIELLIVVAIIAILASMLLPALARARYMARIILCLNNTRQITIASLNYTGDYDQHYPGERENNVLRGRSHQSHPEELAVYCGGSVNRNVNPMWKCPEAYVRTQSLGTNPASYYSLYYNLSQGLHSGVGGNFFDGYTAVVPEEAMRRAGDTRIFRTVNSTGGGSYESHIIASCISQRMGFNGALEAGHMWGGPFDTSGGSPLRSWSRASICTAPYGFDDGSAKRYMFRFSGLGDTMAAANDGPLNWDSYLLPKDELLAYP